MNRLTSVALLAAILLVGSAACNIPGKKPDGPPIYALLRLRHPETHVEMLIMMETFGAGTCEAALSEFTRAIYENEDDMEGWKETERDCREALKPLYTRIFNDEQVHATYLKITVKKAGTTRVVSLYGIPASQAQPVCQETARDLQGKLQARAECVQGTEG